MLIVWSYWFITISWFLLNALWLSVVYCFPSTTWSMLLLAEKIQYQFKSDFNDRFLRIWMKKFIYFQTYKIWIHKFHKILYNGMTWILVSYCKLQLLTIQHIFHNYQHIPAIKNIIIVELAGQVGRIDFQRLISYWIAL